jgi:hypothetical protein
MIKRMTWNTKPEKPAKLLEAGTQILFRHPGLDDEPYFGFIVEFDESSHLYMIFYQYKPGINVTMFQTFVAHNNIITVSPWK